MTKTKYMLSEGIAFAENEDLRRLKNYAAEGWIVKRFKGLGYELEQGAPQLVDYSIDVRHLKKDEEEEYFAMFEDAGWEHVSSSYDTHLFKAPAGTTPIYSDNPSKAEKLLRQRKSVVPALWITAFFTVFSYVLLTFSSGLMKFLANILFNVSIILVIPCLLMYAVLSYRNLRLH